MYLPRTAIILTLIISCVKGSKAEERDDIPDETGLPRARFEPREGASVI